MCEGRDGLGEASSSSSSFTTTPISELCENGFSLRPSASSRDLLLLEVWSKEQMLEMVMKQVTAFSCFNEEGQRRLVGGRNFRRR